MNTEIIITWYKGKPAGLWFDDVAIWETKEVIVDVNLLSTTVALPLMEAVSFLTIFVNGMASTNLIELLNAIKTKIAELKELEKNFDNDDDKGQDGGQDDSTEIFNYYGGL